MDDNITMQVEGMDELMDSLNNLVKKYPDRAGDLLVKEARKLRKDVVKLVKNDTDTSGRSKRSLAKLKEYKISRVKGMGQNQYIEISAKAPHFHLVENGHTQVLPKTRKYKKSGKTVTLKNGGKVVGYTVGYHFMDRASNKRRIEIPQELEATIDKILREEGLL